VRWIVVRDEDFAATDSETPQWIMCSGCRQLIFHKRYRRLLRVCPQCGHHARLTAHQRITTLLDPESVEIIDLSVASADPLGFVDSQPYPRRLDAARAATGLREGVLCARGTVRGEAVIVAAMDFNFMGGSLGGATGELVTLAADTALRDRTPLLIVSASGGARMQEGAISLMQMAKTSRALGRLDEAGVLTISLVTDPTFGGVAASFASLCDVTIAEPGARMGFAGRRVIEQTIRETLPADFQTAEFLLAHGLIDGIHRRDTLRAALARLLRCGSAGQRPQQPPAPAPVGGVVEDADALPERDPWDVVQLARKLERPSTLDYLRSVFVDFEELHGDRASGDCPAVVGGTALLDDQPVVVVGHQKGQTIAERSARNFGMPTPAGYRKAARLMRLAAKLGTPLVTFIDTPGAFPGAQAEEQGQSIAIAECIRTMAGLPVPVVAVVTGEGGSGGALALGVANRVFALSNTIYSVISPEGCAAILWNDPAAARRAATALRVDAPNLLRFGVVDGVLLEPENGADGDPATTADRVRAALSATLRELAGMRPAELVAQRELRFRRFGADSRPPKGENSLSEEGMDEQGLAGRTR
jgi:acetyl-CoA carboxylase carboxyl transferase alpha subunit/acetyl-CoA carboxylase carboxyl transferase beta subunit